jgi:thiamine pyrophosphate-dependent acetolactate synthase large subunit-like protein
MNGAQALFKALTDAGLDTCFANPGTSEMQLVYEIGLTEDVRAVLCLQENTVTGAADGYARMAGKPAFTLLHVGSGFANGIASMKGETSDGIESSMLLATPYIRKLPKAPKAMSATAATNARLRIEQTS